VWDWGKSRGRLFLPGAVYETSLFLEVLTDLGYGDATDLYGIRAVRVFRLLFPS